VWFSNYNATINGLSKTPFVYLVPAGIDVLLAPCAINGIRTTREWKIVDQLIPTPFDFKVDPGKLTDFLENASAVPIDGDFVSGEFAEIRKFAKFQAYQDQGDVLVTSPDFQKTELVGRSVWNTQWLLIIPGIDLLGGDPDEGIH